MNHLSLVPVLRVLKWCLHLLLAGLLALAVVRALVDGAPHPAAIVVSGLVLGAVYAAGPLVPAIGRGLAPTAAWLLVLGIMWLVLLALTPDGLWLAFPLYFLFLHLLPPRAGLISVAVAALLGACGYAVHQDSFSVAVFLGPVLGAAFAVATVFGYQALYRENEERRRLIQQLTTARTNLESIGRQAGMMAERERLAREIHDTLAQGLSSIQLLLSAAERSLGTTGGESPGQGQGHDQPQGEGPSREEAHADEGAGTDARHRTVEPRETAPAPSGSASSASGPATTPASAHSPAPQAPCTAGTAATGADVPTAARYVAQARKAAQDNLAEARRFVHALVPPDLEGKDASLPVALEQLSDTTTVRHGVPVHFHLSGTPSRLPTPYEVVVLRVAQSALANAVAHAEARSIEVTLSYMDKELALDVVDDGVGFDPKTLPAPEPGEGGFGLAAMRARARALGGSLSVESAPGHGTAIALQLPVSYAEAMKFPASLGYRP